MQAAGGGGVIASLGLHCPVPHDDYPGEPDESLHSGVPRRNRRGQRRPLSFAACPYHFGITSFGVNAWTGREAGDRIIKEHDEAEDEDGQEELYLVQHGRARFELDGERIEAPANTLIFVRPGVKRTAFAEEPGTTIIALGGTPGKAYEPTGSSSGRRSSRSTRQPSTPRPLIEGTT